MYLPDERQRVDKLLIRYKMAKSQYKEEKQALEREKLNFAHIEEAQKITQNVAQHIQQQAHSKIVGVVNRCLETIFGGDYGFRIDFERKRGRTEAKLLLLKDGNEIEDALNEDSGGVVEVAGFALRLACLLLAKPNLRKVLILDEPFKNVSLKNMESIKGLLEGLAEDFQVQFIIVTHLEMLQIGKVVKL